MSEPIMDDEKRKRIQQLLHQQEEKDKDEAAEIILSFNKLPLEIKEYLDKYIIGQDNAKKVVATGIAYHYKRIANALKKEIENNGGDFAIALKNVKTPKANILLIGPSGCGKTYTAEKCADFVNVPFVKEDMTKFSETGYVGRDLNEIIYDMISSAGENFYLSQLGIIYLDEIDKIVSAPVVGRDVSGTGVQNGLLKLVEGSETSIKTMKGAIPFSTKNILFIGSGAFEGIENIVKNRLARQKVKFKDWRDYLLTYDLVEYGMQTQLMGRFPVRAFYDTLTNEDLVKIMKTSQDSPLKAYQEDLANWGIELKFTDSALNEIAKAAEREKTGARGLVGILNKVLLEPMYSLPGKNNGKKMIPFLVDENYVKKILDGDLDKVV